MRPNLSVAFIFAGLLVVGTGAFAQGEALQRCPRIADPAARLACYDALLPPVGAAATGPAAAPDGAAMPAAGAPAAARASFGLAEKPRADEVQAIESRVGADFDGWRPNQRIRLQNGQVWQVIDGSSGSVADSAARVRVRRGMLGSYFMEFDGLNNSPRVRRVE